MLVFVVRRLLISIPVLIASTIATFIIVKLAGDPLLYLKQRHPLPSHQLIQSETDRLWLNHSWPSQYWHWISNIILHWQWGQIVQGHGVIQSTLFHSLWITARLVFFAVVVALLLAVATGVYSAVKQYSITDYSTTFLGFLFLSMPVFWFGLLLKQGGVWFNGQVGDQVFKTLGSPSSWTSPHALVAQLLLPMITLGLVSYAAWSRFTRASMLEVLNSDYVRLARAKGLPPRTVLVKHALRTALIPLTTVTALDIAALLGGTIITETVFQWQGMGYFFVNALQKLEMYELLGWLLVSATIVILFNLIADILYGVLDPRIRHA
jgi:peptide/nickel transport system permease protein